MIRREFFVFTVLALFVLLISACTSVQPETPQPEATPETALISEEQVELIAEVFETTWTVASFGGEDEPISSVDGTFPSLNFMSLRYTGFTGCNYFVGSYRFNEQGLRLDPPQVTTAVCENDLLQQQESAFLTILITVDSAVFDGETIVMSAEGRQLMTLTPLESVPFEGTTWNYRFYQGEINLWQPVLPDTSITATFDAGTVSGSAGCNDYTASYVINDSEISISDIATTFMMCTEPADIMAQETRYLAGLEAATNIQISPRTIQLFTNEQPIMLFGAD